MLKTVQGLCVAAAVAASSVAQAQSLTTTFASNSRSFFPSNR